MNILITGGAGFIGSNLTHKLIQNGHQVTILDNLSEQIHGSNPLLDSPLYISILHQVNFIKGSVTNADDLRLAIKNQDVIVHLAAETGTGQSMYQIARYVDVNIGGTALLLDVLANEKHGVKKMIIASSRAIYGEGRYWSDELGYVYPAHRINDDLQLGDYEVKYTGCSTPLKLVATNEASKIHPSSVYGITKQNQEQLVMTVCPTINIAPVAFRYQNVYGPGQSLSNPYTGILSIFSNLIRNNKEINVFEDGMESRDFVFIDDVVDATTLGIEQDAANNHVFNVGTGIPTTVKTVIEELMASYQANVPLNFSGNYRLGDIRHNYADLTKIKSVLDFTPKVSFKEGVRKFAAWVNTQQVKMDLYQQSLQQMKDKGLLK